MHRRQPVLDGEIGEALALGKELRADGDDQGFGAFPSHGGEDAVELLGMLNTQGLQRDPGRASHCLEVRDQPGRTPGFLCQRTARRESFRDELAQEPEPFAAQLGGDRCVMPVTFPLATPGWWSPRPTGSALVVMTIGIVAVACRAAWGCLETARGGSDLLASAARAPQRVASAARPCRARSARSGQS